MSVAFLFFLAGLVLGFLARGQLESHERLLPRGLGLPTRRRREGQMSLAPKNGESEEADELLTAPELVARFGVYARPQSTEQLPVDPAVPDEGGLR